MRNAVAIRQRRRGLCRPVVIEARKGARARLCGISATNLEPRDAPRQLGFDEAERAKGQAWGLKTIETFHTHGTPPIDQYTGPRKR